MRVRRHGKPVGHRDFHDIADTQACHGFSRRDLVHRGLAAGLLCMAAPLRADADAPTARYAAGPAGADGIGKRYIGRDIAGVMGWQGTASVRGRRSAADGGDGASHGAAERAEAPQVPIKRLHKMSEAQIKREAAVHALVWERTVGALPWQHVVVFRKRG